MAGTNADFGERGERLAEDYLRSRGFALVARRFRTQAGEIDLIMRDAGVLVFVEVKTRRDDALADPEDAVRADKRARLVRAARWYVRAKHLEDAPCRFDLVTVVQRGDDPPEIRHHLDAFAPRNW